jgi:capsule polysaccharide export protein KpsC/LpsZ
MNLLLSFSSATIDALILRLDESSKYCPKKSGSTRLKILKPQSFDPPDFVNARGIQEIRVVSALCSFARVEILRYSILHSMSV